MLRFISIVLAATFLAAHPKPLLAQEQVLKIDQDFTIAVASHPVSSQSRTFYIHSNNLAMDTRSGSVLIRSDLNKTWIMTPTRQPIAIVTLTQIRQFLNPIGAAQSSLPGFTSTGKTTTIAGLPCAIHHGALPPISVDACMTTKLPEFERFQPLLGMPTAARGIPLDLTIVMSKDDGQTVITQRVTRVSRIPLDPSMFAPPTGTPLLSPEAIFPSMPPHPSNKEGASTP